MGIFTSVTADYVRNPKLDTWYWVGDIDRSQFVKTNTIGHFILQPITKKAAKQQNTADTKQTMICWWYLVIQSKTNGNFIARCPFQQHQILTWPNQPKNKICIQLGMYEKKVYIFEKSVFFCFYDFLRKLIFCWCFAHKNHSVVILKIK